MQSRARWSYSEEYMYTSRLVKINLFFRIGAQGTLYEDEQTLTGVSFRRISS